MSEERFAKDDCLEFLEFLEFLKFPKFLGTLCQG